MDDGFGDQLSEACGNREAVMDLVSTIPKDDWSIQSGSDSAIAEARFTPIKLQMLCYGADNFKLKMLRDEETYPCFSQPLTAEERQLPICEKILTVLGKLSFDKILGVKPPSEDS